MLSERFLPAQSRTNSLGLVVKPPSLLLTRQPLEPLSPGIALRQQLLLAVQDGRVAVVSVGAEGYLQPAQLNQERLCKRRVRVSLEARIGQIRDARRIAVELDDVGVLRRTEIRPGAALID